MQALHKQISELAKQRREAYRARDKGKYNQLGEQIKVLSEQRRVLEKEDHEYRTTTGRALRNKHVEEEDKAAKEEARKSDKKAWDAQGN